MYLKENRNYFCMKCAVLVSFCKQMTAESLDFRSVLTCRLVDCWELICFLFLFKLTRPSQQTPDASKLQLIVSAFILILGVGASEGSVADWKCQIKKLKVKKSFPSSKTTSKKKCIQKVKYKTTDWLQVRV